jgi:hypothetical protein
LSLRVGRHERASFVVLGWLAPVCAKRQTIEGQVAKYLQT